MAERIAVVLAVDGLRASALGTYGNTWHPTPAFDALAAQSVVVDWMFRESPGLEGFYQEAWNGALPGRLAERGTSISLVTDDPSVAALAEGATIADVLQIELQADAAATDVSETVLAQVMGVAAEKLQSLVRSPGDRSRLLCIHTRGYHAAWDAPHDLRASLLDADDPAPPNFVAPPLREVTDDHDALLGYRAAYAAQTIILDQCVGGLMAVLEEHGIDDRALVALVGCRGFALGEHGVVGSAVDALYGELLHVPCLFRMPGSTPAPPRCTRLATPRDVGGTLAAWFGLPPLKGASNGDDLLTDPLPRKSYIRMTASGGEGALRTPAWFLRRAAAHPAGASEAHDAATPSSSPAVELYAKPDDRWDANEVADRCPDIVERLLAALDASAIAEVSGVAITLDADLVETAR